jgi:hypothetical protein
MLRPGPLGRGGARRRTRRRVSRRTALVMMTVSQKQQIEKQTGKKPEQLTEDQLNDAMEKNNIEVGSSDKQLDELEKLGQLKESGVLTDQEFEAKKAQILKS